jgi:hypothetical protein
VIGSQESVETIVNSMFKPSKQLIMDLCHEALGTEFFMVRSVSLQATHLVVYASVRIAHLIRDVKSKEVALGFKGKLGNKGGCSISFKVDKTHLCFISCHLHSG